MGRYKGKREAPRPGHEEVREELLSSGAAPVEDPFADETRLFQAGGDFEGGDFEGGDFPTPDMPAEAEKPAFGERCGAFFRSRGGKITIVVLACVLAFAVGGVLAFRSWIKPPDLPVLPDGKDPVQSGQDTPETPDQPDAPDAPTDDELYPDDGYAGDIPTVSGDRKDGVYTFLLVGTDKDDGNTDTIMVASYDTVNQDVNIMSIPRDTMINESWDIKKINSVYSRTGSSIKSLANRVQKLIGFKPDFYVKVELSMFVELVDLVKGVEFDVPRDMDYDDDWQDLHIHLKKGVQVLDGEHAMQLVRFRRYPEGDIKRVQVQQDFMKALIKECLSLKHWGKIKAYIDLALDNVDTDLEFSSVVWFAANVMGLNKAPMLKMEDVYTCTLPGNYYAEAWSRATKQNQSYVTIYPNQVVTLVNERFNPYEQKVNAGMLDAMSILANGDIASSTGTVKDAEHNKIMAVRRGEAYYDENGKIVFGQPPKTPEVDAFGNYYILDENGSVIYTDEKGTPLDQIGPDAPVDPTIPVDPVDPGVDPDPSGETDEPVLPPDGGEELPTGGEVPNTEEPDDSIDEEPPGWL